MGERFEPSQILKLTAVQPIVVVVGSQNNRFAGQFAAVYRTAHMIAVQEADRMEAPSAAAVDASMNSWLVEVRSARHTLTVLSESSEAWDMFGP